MKFEQHPLSAAFPAMSDDDFQALCDDVEVHGQREPVIIFEGMVLDGWHRYQACLRTNTHLTKFDFKLDEDPVAFVKSQNLHRRHLTASQRAAAVVACSAWHPAHRTKKVEPSSTLPKTSAESGDKKKVELGSTLPKTNSQLAKEAGTTVRTVTDAKAAQKAGLIDPVIDGAMTAKEAAKVARGTSLKPEPKPEVEPNDEDDAVSILSEENDRLSARLAVAAMDATPEEKALASETIDGLQAQVKTLTAELDAVKASRDNYMRESSELKKQCAGYKRQLDKLKKG